MVKRRGPGALYKYSAQERGPHSGRDRSTTSPVFWTRSDRDFLLLRVGDRALASRIQALLFCRQPDAPCAHLCSTNLILRYTYPSFGLHPLRLDTSPSSQDERVNAVREELESQPEFYVRDVTDGMQCQHGIAEQDEPNLHETKD